MSNEIVVELEQGRFIFIRDNENVFPALAIAEALEGEGNQILTPHGWEWMQGVEYIENGILFDCITNSPDDIPDEHNNENEYWVNILSPHEWSNLKSLYNHYHGIKS